MRSRALDGGGPGAPASEGAEVSAPAAPPGASWRETAAAFAGAALVALLVLRVGPSWRDSVVGDYDAFQGLWNLDHAERVLRGESPLWSSSRVWAPGGAPLVLHALSPALTLPGAVLARLAGPTLAYGLLVVFCLALTATAFFRLARRAGASAAGAAAGAFACGFSPLLTARAAVGHLNLLPVGLVAVAVEGLVVALSARGRPRLAGSAAAVAALVAVLHTDYYLALLAALAVGVFGLAEVARPAFGRSRAGALGLLAAVALAALVASAPLLGRVREEAGRSPEGGHDPARLSVDAAGLLQPGAGSLVGRRLRGLRGAPTPPEAERLAGLGVLPAAALAWALARRRSPLLHRTALAGGLGLVLSFGPSLVFAGRDTGIPTPYRLLVAAMPALRVGGGANRFLLLALVPLSLGAALAATRLLAPPAARRAPLAVLLGALCSVETIPPDPGRSALPRDEAMVAVAKDPAAGIVLDVDPGIPGLYRQAWHGRAQTFGYLSRVPREAREARAADPLLGPFLDPGRMPPSLPARAAAFYLRARWGIGFVVAPDVDPWRARAAALGFPLLARSEGRSVAWRVPAEAPAAVEAVDFSEPATALRDRAVFLDGFWDPETLPPGAGRWSRERARALFPAASGSWRAILAAPRPGPVVVRLAWGSRGKQRLVRAWDAVAASLDVGEADLGPGGALELRLEAPAFRPDGESRDLGAFLIRVERVPAAGPGR